MAQAKAAAKDRNVLVHGAYTAQRALEAGVLDEVQIHQIPVLFGGCRLFDVLLSRVELEIVRVIDTLEATPHPLPRPSLSPGLAKRQPKHDLTDKHQRGFLTLLASVARLTSDGESPASTL